MNKFSNRALLYIMPCFLMACGSSSVNLRGKRGGAAVSVGGVLKDDASKYTWASLKLNGTYTDASLKREVVWDGPEIKFSAEEEISLNSLCSQVALLDNNQKLIQNEDKKSSSIFAWRAHHHFKDKQTLVSLMDNHNLERVYCRATISSVSGQKVLLVDPLPLEGDLYIGASDIDAAITSGISLALVSSPITNSYSALEVSEVQPDLVVLEVTPLDPNAFKASDPEVLSVSKCFNDINNPGTVADPDLQISLGYQLSSLADHKIVEVIPTTERAVCQDVESEIAEDFLITSNISCGIASRNIVDGSSCDLRLGVANSKDQGNVIGKLVSLSDIPFGQVDLTTRPGVLEAISGSPDNPITNGQTELVNFGPLRERSLSASFDLWLAASPESYAKYFNDHIIRITYLGQNGTACSSGAGAYVDSFMDDKFNWCEGGAMNPEAISDQVYPETLMYLALTSLHESLHTQMHYHDAADPRGANHEPCDGTSKSAVIAHDVYLCDKPICLPFRDLALESYISELDYSLADDPRRNMGQCAIWNANMGL